MSFFFIPTTPKGEIDMHPAQRFLDDRLLLYPGYFSPDRCDLIYKELIEKIQWLHRYYDNPDGKRVYLPRLTANYGELSYDYSGLTFEPQPWTPLLSSLKEHAEEVSGKSFNALILQRYRDGRDSVNWHSDDDPAVGSCPTLVSMSFGASRDFWIRHKEHKEELLKLRLDSGDLLVMQGDLQHTHVHKVPKESCDETRLNLTFRSIVQAP